MNRYDLSIDDWAMNDSGVIGQVYALKRNTIGLVMNGKESDHHLCQVLPIPLTEEILVKNGFGYAYNEVSKMQNKQLLVANIGGHYIEVRLDKKNVAIWYDYDENGDGVYSDVLIDLPHHVHNFQHLLRLCGIEKSIEL